jgi:hypothetical protein
VTQAGCGAICPSYCRECFGCYGPKERSNPASLSRHYAVNGSPTPQLVRLLRNFNAYAGDFAAASNDLAQP